MKKTTNNETSFVSASSTYNYATEPVRVSAMAKAKATNPSQNTVNVFETTAHVVSINPALVSPATLAYLQGYNTGEVKADAIETNNIHNLSLINQHEVAAQFSIVLTMGTFRNAQVKQTFKISLQRYFSRCYKGKALLIKGNAVAVTLLQPGQVIGIKGEVRNEPTAEELAKVKADKEKKARLLLEAEQNEIRLEEEKKAKEQAEALAASLVKKEQGHKEQIKQVESKAKKTVDLLAAQVADLTRQLEYAKHETAGTVAAYQELKAMIMGKTTIAELRAKVGGVFLAERQAVNA